VNGGTNTPLPDGVTAMIPAYLSRQRWFAGGAEPQAGDVEVLASDLLAALDPGTHRLWWSVVRAEGARYQLVIGERPSGEPAEFLNAHRDAVLGANHDAYFYDATLDPEMSLVLLDIVTEGKEPSARVRPVTTEQSNTSLVYDDRVIMKLFRRLFEGRNPDVEVTMALDRAGFDHVAAPVAAWARGDDDLAFVQQYLSGGVEGWALALTSLRDLYAAGPDDPAQAGGDFGAESSRLGKMTARMHLSLADAFGVDRDGFRSVGWARLQDDIEARVRRVVGAAWPGSAADLLRTIRNVSDPGPGIRVHGDYHLGQVMRTDAGWYVLDFEGEPARSMEERAAFQSPLKDVTGMFRSFQYAAHFALLEREDEHSEHLQRLAEAWEGHNRNTFLDGYLSTDGIDALLPEGGPARAAVTLAFELDKVLYELAYEQDYRPEWASIPAAAIHRLMAAGSPAGPTG
jgi:maltokinase